MSLTLLALGFLSTAISRQHQFVSAEVKRTLTIQVADYVSVFLPKLVQRLRKAAPGVSIDLLPFTISKESVWDRLDMQVRLTPGRLKPGMVRSQRLYGADTQCWHYNGALGTRS